MLLEMKEKEEEMKEKEEEERKAAGNSTDTNTNSTSTVEPPREPREIKENPLWKEIAPASLYTMQNDLGQDIEYEF